MSRSIEQGEPLRVAMEVRFHAALDDPVFGLYLRNQVGHTIFATRTDCTGQPTGRFGPGDVATMRVALDNRLAPERLPAHAVDRARRGRRG